MTAFQDTPGSADTVTDPAQGLTGVTGNWSTFTPTDPGPPAADIEFVAATTATGDVAVGSFIDIAYPAGTIQGDALLLFLSYDKNGGSSENFSISNSGLSAVWNHIADDTIATNDHKGELWGKVAFNDDPATLRITHNAGSSNCGIEATIVAFHSDDGQIEYEAWAGVRVHSTASTSHSADSITTSNDGSVIVYGVAGPASSTFTPGTGMTEVVDVQRTSVSLGVAYSLRPTAGTPFTASMTSSASMKDVSLWVTIKRPDREPVGYSGWLKIVLTQPADLDLNTYGSAMPDTTMAIFDHIPSYLYWVRAQNTDGSFTFRVAESLAWNDDTLDPNVDPSDSLHSQILISLGAGTYYLAVWPFDGDWSPGDGDASLSLVRNDDPETPTIAEIRWYPRDYPDVLTGGGSSQGTGFTNQLISFKCDIKKTFLEMNAGYLPGVSKIWFLDERNDQASYASLGYFTAYPFSIGDELTCDINGQRVWGGFIQGIRYAYAFPADDVYDEETFSVRSQFPNRYQVLEVSDYNLLFQRRFIANYADPTNRIPKYAAGVHDDVVILDMVANYLDLSGDHITTDGVQHVGTPQEDAAGSPIVPAMDWGTGMKNIALMPGAIFFIDPDKNLCYADVDEEDAPFALSDTPSEPDSYGYGNMELLEDGTQLANDALVWGAAVGVDHMTFKRYQDTDSEDEHGRWQWADFRQDLYKPESVLKRAQSYVDGSTQNNRGHKDDAISIRCRIRQPGLRAGMKVDFTNNVYGYNDVIPIRSMRITFVNPSQALYDLYLAHYLDQAWNTAEFPPLPIQPPVRVCTTTTGDCTDYALLSNSFIDHFDRVYISETEHRWSTGFDSPNPLDTGSYFNVAVTDDGGTAYILNATPGVDLQFSSFWATNSDGNIPYRTPGTDPFSSAQNSDIDTTPPTPGVAPVPYLVGHHDPDSYGMHYDWEARQQYKFRFRGTQYPANPTRVGYDHTYNYYGSGSPQEGEANSIKHSTNVDAVKDTTMMVQTGEIVVGSPAWDLGGGPGITVNQGDGTQTGDLIWEPTDGFLDHQFVMGGDLTNGAGRLYVPSQNYTGSPDFVAPNTLTDRYPNDLYSAVMQHTDILGHHHTDWGSNQSTDGASYGPLDGGGNTSVPWLSAFFNASDGWGDNGTFNWNLVDQQGDDWTDTAYVAGGYGVLAVHTSLSSGVPGDTYVSSDDTIDATSFDYTFRVRFALPNPVHADPWDSTYLYLGFTPSGLWISPSADAIVFSFDAVDWISTSSLGLNWFSDVNIRIAQDTTSGRIKLWQFGDAEPSSWFSTDLALALDGSVISIFPTAELTAGGTGEAQRAFVGPGLDVACTASIPESFVEGSVTAFTADGQQIGVIEVDPSLGSIAVATDSPITVCYYPGNGDQGTTPVPTGGSVYRPGMVRQLGWGSALDGFNCTMASACMALDRHTNGGKTSDPPTMRSFQSDQVGGTDLNDAADAWSAGYSESLDVEYGITWATFVSTVNGGSGAMLQGDYSQIPNTYSCQPSFDGPHCMYVNEFNSNGAALVYDPLCSGPRWMPAEILRAYAVSFGGGLVDAAFT